jgi:hypothetical protein
MTIYKTIRNLIYLAGIIILIFSASACTSTKDIAKNKTVVDSTVIKDLQDSVRVLKTENAHLSTEIRELQYSGVSFQDRCDTAALRRILTSGLVDKSVIEEYLHQMAECSDQVKIASDGTIEAKGKLKSAYYSSDKLTRMVYDLKRENDSLRSVKQKTIDHYYKITETKIKHSKTRVLNFLIFLLIGAVGGVLIWEKWIRKLSLFKSLIK